MDLVKFIASQQVDSLAIRVMYYCFFALIAAFVWFLVGLPAWQSQHTDIAFSSFIAFSAIACIAISLLSVVKTLTEVFGGTISVEDRVPGDFTQGTVFIVTLPKAP